MKQLPPNGVGESYSTPFDQTYQLVPIFLSYPALRDMLLEADMAEIRKPREKQSQFLSSAARQAPGMETQGSLVWLHRSLLCPFMSTQGCPSGLVRQVGPAVKEISPFPSSDNRWRAGGWRREAWESLRKPGKYIGCSDSVALHLLHSNL